MTNTESRKAVELDRLASWDNEDEPTPQYPITEADIRELLVYNFDSDKQTLVGLGPIERARRSRAAAEAPDSQRMPQSEAPGPFVADDDEAPPSFRKPMVAWWAVVGPALAAGLAVLALRGAAPDDADSAKLAKPAALTLPVAAAAPPVAAPEIEPALAAEIPASAPESAPPAETAAPRTTPNTAAPPVVPVQLAEVPPPSVVTLPNDVAAANLGTVNVTSSPPANVVLDGRPIGKAPRLVQVPAGVHKLVFIHPLYGRQSQSVNVTAGQTASVAASF
jgi:hypothetical protein